MGGMKRAAFLAGWLLGISALAFGTELAAGLRGSFGYGGFLGPSYPPYEEGTHYQERVFFPDWEAAAFLTLGDPFSVQLEALYMHLGGALREEVGAPYYTTYFRADYLGAAALLKYRLRRQSLFAGPVGLHRIGPGSLKIKREDGSTDQTDFPDGELSPFLLALACGLEYRLGPGPGGLVLELRWLYSLHSFFSAGEQWNPYALLVSVGLLLARSR
jgi:hypothetical protein